MTSSRQFAPHLPDLRRYARAISNSEASAEAVVYAALASLVEVDPGAVAGLDARLAMFRTAHRIWERLARSAANEDGADAFSSWPPLEWATFLLVTMESFTPSETAVITGQSIVEVEATLRRWVHAAVASDCFGRPPRTETDPRWAFIQGWPANEQISEPWQTGGWGACYDQQFADGDRADAEFRPSPLAGNNVYLS